MTGRWQAPVRGLRARLRLVAAAVAIAFLALAFVRARERQLAEQQRLGQRAQENALAAREAFDSAVREARTLLSVVAFGINELGDARRDPVLKGLGRRTALPYASLFVLDSAGRFLASTSGEPAAAIAPTCVQRALREPRFTVCAPFKPSRTDPAPWVLTYLMPATSRARDAGFVGASLPIDSLEAVRLARRLPAGSVLTLLDSAGFVMLRTLDADGWIGRLFPNFPTRERDLQPLGSDTVVNSEIDQRQRLFGSTYTRETGWRLFIGIPVEEAFAPSRRQFVQDLLIAAVISAGILLLGYALSARIVGPIESLTRDARAISDGDMTRRSAVRGDDEVGTLARAFNQMADAIVERTTALATSQEQLRQAQKLEALGGFAGGVAHEFNNYLSSIIGHAELALAASRDPVTMRAEVGGILSSATRAADLTRQVLVFSRREVIAARLVEVAPVLRNLARLLERLLGERIVLQVEVAEGLGPVRIDPGRLEQVLMNLAANARDAMPHGGAVLMRVDRAPEAVCARLGLADRHWVRFCVADSGPGVPAEVRARLFEPFFTTKAREHGTGLGLSISYGIVQSAGGVIELDPTVTEGAAFCFYLPEAQPDGPPEPVPERPTPPSTEPASPAASLVAGLPGGSERLLLVEDDASVAEVARRLLTRAGYTVVVLHDGEAALVALDTDTFDLMVSDVVMPGMSGAVLAQQARQRHPTLRVLLMSGYPDDDLVAHEIARQQVSFLAKPFSQASLLQAVRERLDRPDG